MAIQYKIIEANSDYSPYVFDNLESAINRAAKEGYKLKERSIQVFREDRSPNQTALCRAIAVMTKEEKREKSDIVKRTEEVLGLL